MVRKEHGRAEERRVRFVTRDSDLTPENHESAGNRLVDNSTPSPVFFVRVASKGLMDAIVISADSSGVKSVCFHTVWRPIVSADSKGVECYLNNNYIY